MLVEEAEEGPGVLPAAAVIAAERDRIWCAAEVESSWPICGWEWG